MPPRLPANALRFKRLLLGPGYYRRAVHLHRLARTVETDHGGVASFALERRAPAVDTNVARVLSRVFRLRGAGADGP